MTWFRSSKDNATFRLEVGIAILAECVLRCVGRDVLGEWIAHGSLDRDLSYWPAARFWATGSRV